MKNVVLIFLLVFLLLKVLKINGLFTNSWKWKSKLMRIEIIFYAFGLLATEWKNLFKIILFDRESSYRHIILLKVPRPPKNKTTGNDRKLVY